VGGSPREVDARAGWTDVVRDLAPTLHALGYALTGSLAEAEWLLQVALAEVAADWEGPEDDGHGLADACRVLVGRFERGGPDDGASLGERLVVTQPASQGYDPDLEQRLPAWQRLQALDRAHRAVLVLRRLPATAGLDAARVLGVRRRDLPERERSAATAFGDGLADLSAALTAVTGQLPAVVVDAAGEARLARPRRRRRAWGTGLAAVAALALVVWVGAAVLTGEPPDPLRPPALDLDPLTPEQGPRPLDSMPVGAPTDVPYWSEGVLHVDGRAYRTVVPRSLQWAGDAVLVAGAGRSQVVTGDAIAGLPVGVTSIRLAPDGRLLAWVIGRLVVAVEVEGDGLGEPVTLDTAELTGPEDVVRVQSVLTDGRVVVQMSPVPRADDVTGGSAGRAVVWTPGEEPVPVRLPRGVLLGFEPVPWPGGISWLDPGSGIVLGRVAEDGAVRPVGELSFGGGTWDPEGRVIAQVYATVPYVLSPFEGGFAATRLPLPPPQDRSWQVVGWESGGSVVAAVAGPGFLARTLVRCRLPALYCERIGGLPSGSVVFPG
jgi:hypothetical protein